MPPDFNRLNLADSLVQLCLEFEERSGIECRLSVQKDLDLSGLGAEKQLQCYRIVQEALTNAEKHSGAREVAVSARNARPGGGPELLRIWVSDDGRGLPAPEKPPAPGRPGVKTADGLGLRGMYERAAILGGALELSGEAGGGLTVRLEIPLGGGP
jgi:signal transduction histidine kinase